MTITTQTARLNTGDIFEDLRVGLTTARFDPGAKLMPQDLRAIYGCSANTIREVLLRLSFTGLVVFEEQRGFRVRRTSSQRLHDLAIFRIQLEQEGLARSIERGGVAWEAQLSAAHYKLRHIEEQAETPEKLTDVLPLWCAAEWEFHDTLLAACDSPCLRESYRGVYDQFRQQRVTLDNNFGHIDENILEHQLILEAALAHDTVTARQHVYNHLKRNLLPNQS